MMFWYGTGMNGWGYALMTVGLVVFWGLVIVGLIMLVRYVTRSGEQSAQPSIPAQVAPEQVLAERFARGEIDADEYQKRLDTLRSTAPRS